MWTSPSSGCCLKGPRCFASGSAKSEHTQLCEKITGNLRSVLSLSSSPLITRDRAIIPDGASVHSCAESWAADLERDLVSGLRKVAPSSRRAPIRCGPSQQHGCSSSAADSRYRFLRPRRAQGSHGAARGGRQGNWSLRAAAFRRGREGARARADLKKLLPGFFAPRFTPTWLCLDRGREAL